MRTKNKMPELTKKDIDKFWSRVAITANPKECWDWQRRKDSFGYGEFDVKQKKYKAHRIAYFLATKVDPGQLCVLHHCDRPSCTNFSHLFIGTDADNIRDMWAKGRHAKPVDFWRGRVAPKGEDNPASKLSESQVYEIVNLYSGGKETLKSLAKKYNVTFHTVHKVVTGKNWKYLNIGLNKEQSKSVISENCSGKLTVDDVKKIKTHPYTSWAVVKELAKEYNVVPATIHFILIGKTWKHVLLSDEKGSPYYLHCRPTPKINDTIALNIRKEYGVGNTTSRKLAAKFNVDKKTIMDIVHFKTWKHVKVDNN